MTTIQILAIVAAERQRQDQLVASGEFPFNCSAPDIDPHRKLPILGEEFGEVAKALYEHSLGVGSEAHLKTELIQLAAVAVAWAESIPAEPSTLSPQPSTSAP